MCPSRWGDGRASYVDVESWAARDIHHRVQEIPVNGADAHLTIVPAYCGRPARFDQQVRNSRSVSCRLTIEKQKDLDSRPAPVAGLETVSHQQVNDLLFIALKHYKSLRVYVS